MYGSGAPALPGGWDILNRYVRRAVIGLAHTPNEWEWSYILMLLLSIAMFGLAPGRYFGLDRLLRPRFRALSERGSRAGRLLLLLT